MKLVEIARGMWVDPDDVSAVLDASEGLGTRIVVDGQMVSVPWGLTATDVIGKLFGVAPVVDALTSKVNLSKYEVCVYPEHPERAHHHVPVDNSVGAHEDWMAHRHPGCPDDCPQRAYQRQVDVSR